MTGNIQDMFLGDIDFDPLEYRKTMKWVVHDQQKVISQHGG